MGHTEKEDMKVGGILLGRSGSAGGKAGEKGKGSWKGLKFNTRMYVIVIIFQKGEQKWYLILARRAAFFTENLFNCLL